MKFVENVAVWVFATVALAAIAFAAGQELPAGEGKAIVEANCTQCHDATTATQLKQSREEWIDTVKTMQSFGSAVSDKDFPVLIDYLAAHFVKGGAAADNAPAAAPDGELPAGEGRDLVAVACTSCHDLTNVTTAKMNKDEWLDTVQRMVNYGTALDEKGVTTVVNYLAANFHK